MTEDEDSDLEAKLSLPSLGRTGRARGGRRRRKTAAPEQWWTQEHSVAQARRTPPVGAAPPVMREVWVAQARSAPEPAPIPTPAPTSAPAVEPTPEAVAEPVVAAPPPAREPEPEPVPSEPGPAAATEPSPERAAPARRRRQLPALPSVEGRVAALVTGVVVGLTGVLLVYLSESGCAAVRGADSCGGAGIVLLVAIFALLVLEGAALLHALRVENQTSTALLAVGLLAVLTILLLLPVVDRWWMVLVIPVVSAATFLGSWWVSTTYGPAGERS